MLLQRWVRGQPLLYRLTVGTRILLAVGFIPTGMVKLLGRRFAYMSPETPLGGFFETLYLSGPYWHFLGLTQVVAGILVLVPATATVGAMLFFGIIANIFVITLSYDFSYTPFVTGGMLLATGYLLLWDYHRLRPLLGRSAAAQPAAPALPHQRLRAAERVLYVIGFVAGLGYFSGVRNLLVPWPWHLWLVSVAAVSMLTAIVLGLRHAWR